MLSHPSKMAPDEGPPATISFRNLPFEITQLIGLFIDDEKSLAAFRRTCRATNSVVADASFWRQKFQRTYDIQGVYTNEEWRQMYQGRAMMLRNGLKYNFSDNMSVYESKVILMLRRLITDSFMGVTEVDQHGRLVSKNQGHLVQFIRNGRILNHHPYAPVSNRDPSDHEKDVLAAVKLMCFHFILEFPELSFRYHDFDLSQFAVYRSRIQAPLFSNGYTQVNFPWLLHNMNFFRHHMMDPKLWTLYDKFHALDDGQKPTAWREQLGTADRTLSTYWRGTFGYIHDREIARLQIEGPGLRMYHDHNIEEGKMDTIRLEFAEHARLSSGKELRWPLEYENKLDSLFPFADGHPTTFNAEANCGVFPDPTPFVNLSSVKTDSRMFQGKGIDNGNPFLARGWVNPLPNQGDIPGWSRFTMMKAYVPYRNHAIDNLWAYEGVVLPGNRVIMGRWWFASEDSRPYTGPFVLWAVEKPDADFDYDLEGLVDYESASDEDDSEMEADE